MNDFFEFETLRTTSAMGTVEVQLPKLTDDLPPELKDAIARKRMFALTGQCPCGATLTDAEFTVVASRTEEGRTIAQVVSESRHAPGCGANDQRLLALARAHVERLVQRVIDDAPPTPPGDAP